VARLNQKSTEGAADVCLVWVLFSHQRLAVEAEHHMHIPFWNL